MFDIWGFLLQTLTASGVAVLLLVIKALFKDKLPPKWHFAVWGVLGMIILIPAGFHGRYTLLPWQTFIEVLKSLVGEYAFTRVLFPIPLLIAIPSTIPQWIFALYILGVVIHATKYAVSYIRLRLLLRNGVPPSEELTARIQQTANAQQVKVGRVIAMSELPSAFVCGVIRPVLVIPANSDIDDKVILHELLHLKYKDTLWSVVICLLRCLHWCNPLIVYCTHQALSDLESRCDQYVLEQLEGEERRAYGQILLSMANDRFAKTPASTCINNGGKRIRERIEAIARFKQYPVGMRLVSVCVMILISLSLVVGVQASVVYESNSNAVWLSLASARSTPCTTPAGAFDTYAKSVLDQNGIYRVMCAPESMQKELIEEIKEKEQTGIFPNWDCGLNEWPNAQSGYYIYNLKQRDKTTYEGLFVIKVNYPPNGQPEEEGAMYLAVQSIKAEKENGRWVVAPSEGFRNVEATEQSLEWGCLELPGIVYSATQADFRIDVKIQTVYTVENTVQHGNSNFSFGNGTSVFDTTPKPNTEFTRAARTQSETLTHLGTAEDRERVEGLGLSIAPIYAGENRPKQLTVPTGYHASGSNSNGEGWSSQRTEPGWGPTVTFNSGGATFDPKRDAVLPKYFAADLYVNDALVAQTELLIQEGGAP